MLGLDFEIIARRDKELSLIGGNLTLYMKKLILLFYAISPLQDHLRKFGRSDNVQ